MAYIDVDSLAQFEFEARTGRPEALYNLGLAYSTGQGVTQDMSPLTNGSISPPCAG